MLNLDERYRGCLARRRFPEQASKGRRSRTRETKRFYYIRDILIVGNCEALYRLHGTTQVFIGREEATTNDRLLHTMEVASLSKYLAWFLGLNEHLTEAIALGHDTGHSPFGHFGEETISHLCQMEIDHRKIACLILQHVENEGKGLDLTYETLLGIYHHSGTSQEEYGRLPQEFRLVNIVDKIYMFSDIEDGLRIGAGFEEANNQAMYFGRTKAQRIEAFANALVKQSALAGSVSFPKENGSEDSERFWQLRDWMYENAYIPLNACRQPFANELERCYEFLQTSREFEECPPALLLTLMNDAEIHRLFGALRNKPKPELSRSTLNHLNLSITRIYPFIRGWSHDLEDPDLDWGKNTGPFR